MKKILTIAVLFAIILLAGNTAVSAKSQFQEKPDLKIYVDGKLGVYSSNPIMVEGKIFLPLREILINLGVPNDAEHITWNGREQSVAVMQDAIEVNLKVGSKSAFVNDTAISLDAPPVDYNDRVYISAGFVSQISGKKVECNDASESIIIGSSPDPSIKQVIVNNAEELVKELGPEKRILLKPGIYDLSSIKQTENNNKTVTWKEVYDGKELNISNISNLSIEGPYLLRAEIRVTPRFAEIMNFNNCSGITVKNIKAGHKPDTYICDAGVLNFEGCTDITISNSELYGCGSIGLEASNTKGLICMDTLIDHCSLRAISLFMSEDIKFSGCKISDHEAYSNIVYLQGSKDVSFENCDFTDNNYFEWSFFEVTGQSDLLIDNCRITNNLQPEASDWDSDAYFFKTVDYLGDNLGKIVVKDTEISNNRCNYLYDNKENVIFENCKMNDNKWEE